MTKVEKERLIFPSICNGWNSWNHLLDACTKKVVQVAVCCLPSRAQTCIGETYLTQTQLMLDSLGKVIWLQCTIGNPFISPWAAGILGILGVIATAKPFCHYAQAHLQNISTLSSPMCREQQIVFAILSGASELIEIIFIYRFWLHAPYRTIKCISLFLWHSYITFLWNVVSHAMDLQGKKNVKDWITDRANERRDRSVRFSIYLEAEIKELKEKLRKLDLFVESYAELKEVCREHLKKHTGLYDECKPPFDHFDSKNYVHQEARLGFKKLVLERALEERRYFVNRWPKVRECFLKYVKLQQQREADHKGAVISCNEWDFFDCKEKR